MKKLYFLLICACLAAASMTAQTFTVAEDLDPLGPDFPATNLSAFVDANTDENTTSATFILKRGGRYFFDAKKEWVFDVAFVAEEAPVSLTDPMMPLLFRFNAGATNLAPMYEGTGNLTIDGLHVIMGEEQPGAANYENSSIRPRGVDKRYIFRNSWIEKSRQAIARIEGDGSKSYVENCLIQNMGDYKRFQGNGRLIDVRTTAADSVVITNNVIGNILDRLYIGFRQRSNNYFEFTNNTVYNHVGRHGLIQLSNTKTAKINNNLFSNPKMMGTTPSISDEQISFDNQITYLFTSDTIAEGGSIEMLNNNIFYTDDVLEFFNTTDSVAKAPILGPNFTAALSSPVEDAFFEDKVELISVPSRAPVLEYTKMALNDRASLELTDMMVEPLENQGTPFDEGYIFDFSTFNPCFVDGSPSTTGATDGFRVGARTACTTVGTRDIIAYNQRLNLKASPNPAGSSTTISYTLTETGVVNVILYDALGKQVATVFTGEQVPGEHNVEFNGMGQLATGMYFANLFTAEGRMFTRIVKN